MVATYRVSIGEAVDMVNGTKDSTALDLYRVFGLVFRVASFVQVVDEKGRPGHVGVCLPREECEARVDGRAVDDANKGAATGVVDTDVDVFKSGSKQGDSAAVGDAQTDRAAVEADIFEKRTLVAVVPDSVLYGQMLAMLVSMGTWNRLTRPFSIRTSPRLRMEPTPSLMPVWPSLRSVDCGILIWTF